VKPSKKKKRSLLLTIILMSIMLPSTATANAKGEQLRRTMADISLLNGQMAQRKADAAEIRDALSVKLKEIKIEATRELQYKRIKTEADAMGNPRVWYDLLLMAEIQAYIDRYTQKIGHYRLACDRLSYLYQQADDDLKIVSTLSDMKVDALISQAEKILDDYLPDAQTIVIQPGDLSFEPPEKIWKSFKTGK
jgi:hypothetical protein